MKRPKKCRYGVNGYFGHCDCEQCAHIVVITDQMRMEWLVARCVEVRNPLRYGSEALFTAQTVNDDDEEHRTDLREQIDAHIRHAVLKNRGLTP